MSSRVVKIAAIIAAAIAVAVAAFVLGRVSADAGKAFDRGNHQGRVTGYVAGVVDGAAQGRQEGRAAQQSGAPARDAFNAGYAAGADDEFAGYDGGWGLDTPYLITLERGNGQITYRIATRDQVQPSVAYYLCPDGHSVCQQRR
jgi:hypothetical protein